VLVVWVMTTGTGVDAGATVELGAGVDVCAGTAVGVPASAVAGVGVAANIAGGRVGIGVESGVDVGVGVAAAFFLMANWLEVAWSGGGDPLPPVATITNVPVGLPGAL
jgi:hypothetical protein